MSSINPKLVSAKSNLAPLNQDLTFQKSIVSSIEVQIKQVTAAIAKLETDAKKKQKPKKSGCRVTFDLNHHDDSSDEDDDAQAHAQMYGMSPGGYHGYAPTCCGPLGAGGYRQRKQSWDESSVEEVVITTGPGGKKHRMRAAKRWSSVRDSVDLGKGGLRKVSGRKEPLWPYWFTS